MDLTEGNDSAAILQVQTSNQLALNEEINKQRDLNKNLSLNDKLEKLLDISSANQFRLNLVNANLAAFCESAEKRFKAVEEKVERIESDVATNSSAINNQNLKIEKLESQISELQDFVVKTKIETVNKEVHGRRYNLIFGNIKDSCAWETPEKAEKLVRELLHEINFPVNDQDTNMLHPNDIVIKEVHRLPQNPMKFNFSGFNEKSKKPQSKNRLMVVKFAMMTDIDMILRKSPNLKKINDGRLPHERYYIDKHLPKCLQDQKNKLRTQFNQLKKDGKKPRFRYDLETASMFIKVNQNNNASL